MKEDDELPGLDLEWLKTLASPSLFRINPGVRHFKCDHVCDNDLYKPWVPPSTQPNLHINLEELPSIQSNFHSIQPPIPIVTILPQNTKTVDEFSKEFKPLIEKELPVSALKTEVKALRILYKAK